MSRVMTKIPLGHGVYAIVDEADYEWLSRFRWHLGADGSARRSVFRGRAVYMHRVIMMAPHGVDVDHIDGDKLNNQRHNLRLATRGENLRNQKPVRVGTSQFKGVRLHTCGKWAAEIAKDGERYYLGLFDSEEDAARAYDEKALELHGRFAHLNFGGPVAGRCER